MRPAAYYDRESGNLLSLGKPSKKLGSGNHPWRSGRHSREFIAISLNLAMATAMAMAAMATTASPIPLASPFASLPAAASYAVSLPRSAISIFAPSCTSEVRRATTSWCNLSLSLSLSWRCRRILCNAVVLLAMCKRIPMWRGCGGLSCDVSLMGRIS